MLVLGIDPGYAACGVALVDVAGRERRCRDCATLRTTPERSLEERLEAVWWAARPWFERLNDLGGSVVAIEDQSGAQQGARERGRASHEAQGVLRVEGLLRALSWSYGAHVVPVAPQQIKRAFGLRATASKAQVVRAARAMVPGLPDRLSGHAADAVGAAVAGAVREKLGQQRRR